MLRYEVPAVYDTIMKILPPSPLPEPPYLLIKVVCAASNDPSLRKPKFQRYLLEYRENGLCCERGKTLTATREAYYASIRAVKLRKYIHLNSDAINSFKRILDSSE